LRTIECEGAEQETNQQAAESPRKMVAGLKL
jgi:hypothetical protein